MPLGLDTLLPDPFAKLSDDELGYVEDRLAGGRVQKDAGSERLYQELFKRYGGDALRSAVEKRFNPRQPRNADGEWVSLGGVVPKDVELAHEHVGQSMTTGFGGQHYAVGKKIKRGEKLTRTERKTAKEYVRTKLDTKASGKLTPTSYRRYKDFAAVHGMNLKTPTKSKHPGKQVGSPGARDARNMSDADKIRAFEEMHGRLPTDKELKQAGMSRREDVPIREPDPDMERQRAEERAAERGAEPVYDPNAWENGPGDIESEYYADVERASYNGIHVQSNAYGWQIVDDDGNVLRGGITSDHELPYALKEVENERSRKLEEARRK